MGKVAERLGALEEAREIFERSLACARTGVDDDNPALASFLLNLAGIYVALERYEDAINNYELAEATQSGPDGTASMRARARTRLAKVLWAAPVEAGRDRDRAVALARSALLELEGSDDEAPERAAIVAWLRERGAAE